MSVRSAWASEGGTMRTSIVSVRPNGDADNSAEGRQVCQHSRNVRVGRGALTARRSPA